MALYHVRLKVFSRSRGESATAAAAYRAGVRIEDQRTGEVHDYTKRKGVERFDCYAPPGTPVWTSNPSALFNACEADEVRGKSGRVAREAVLALPAELNAAARVDMVRDICQWLVSDQPLANSRVFVRTVDESQERAMSTPKTTCIIQWLDSFEAWGQPILFAFLPWGSAMIAALMLYVLYVCAVYFAS